MTLTAPGTGAGRGRLSEVQTLSDVAAAPAAVVEGPPALAQAARAIEAAVTVAAQPNETRVRRIAARIRLRIGSDLLDVLQGLGRVCAISV